MTDPVTLTAGAIATLAFQEFIKAGAGEMAKKFTSEAIAKMGELRQKIVARFKGHETVEAELAKAEAGDSDAIALTQAFGSVMVAQAQILDCPKHASPNYALSVQGFSSSFPSAHMSGVRFLHSPEDCSPPSIPTFSHCTTSVLSVQSR